MTARLLDSSHQLVVAARQGSFGAVFEQVSRLHAVFPNQNGNSPVRACRVFEQGGEHGFTRGCVIQDLWKRSLHEIQGDSRFARKAKTQHVSDRSAPSLIPCRDALARPGTSRALTNQRRLSAKRR